MPDEGIFQSLIDFFKQGVQSGTFEGANARDGQVARAFFGSRSVSKKFPLTQGGSCSPRAICDAPLGTTLLQTTPLLVLRSSAPGTAQSAEVENWRKLGRVHLLPPSYVLTTFSCLAFHQTSNHQTVRRGLGLAWQGSKSLLDLCRGT